MAGHERGGWYRVTGAEVRHAIGNRSARQAPREAAEAREEAAATVRELDEQEHERVRQRRRSRAAIRKQKLRALARLLAEGKTQRAAAAELRVSERTIHRWMRQPGFARELAKATSRQERDLERERKREQTQRHHNERRRLRRHNPALYYELYSPATPPERRRAQPPAAAPAQPAPRSRRRQQSHTVPIFPNTREGQQQRLAHYEARKLDSYAARLDWLDAKSTATTGAWPSPTTTTGLAAEGCRPEGSADGGSWPLPAVPENGRFAGKNSQSPGVRALWGPEWSRVPASFGNTGPRASK